MSRSASYSYTVAAARRAEAERRRAEWAQRTSQVTAGHLARYQVILDDLREQGLARFVSSEFEAISRLVERARSLTASDPAAARDLSRQIGPRLGPLPRAARQLRGQSRAAEFPIRPSASFEPRQEPAGNPPTPKAVDKTAGQPPAAPVESPAEVAWRRALAEWTDFLARDLAFADLAALRQQLDASGGLTDATAVQSQIEALRSRWSAEAERQRREEAELAAIQEQPTEAPPAIEDPLSGEVESPDDWESEDPEAARREAVQAVMGALEDAGFQVANPRLVDGEVVVVGTRPSGASATFNLTLDGSLEYDFSGYRGSSCDADIDAVVPALQEVYGIQLTDEVVSWRNPDDEDATSRPQPGRTRNA